MVIITSTHSFEGRVLFRYTYTYQKNKQRKKNMKENSNVSHKQNRANIHKCQIELLKIISKK